MYQLPRPTSGTTARDAGSPARQLCHAWTEAHPAEHSPPPLLHLVLLAFTAARVARRVMGSLRIRPHQAERSGPR